MNHIAPPPEPLIREILLSCLALAPENVRKAPANDFAEAELIASIKAHGLLENLVARADDPGPDGAERFAVVAGGRRLAALKALAENGTLDIDLETLNAFSVTTDHDRQRAIWERVAGQGYRPSAWQVKRLLTEERVPAGSPMARFVGVDAYEAAGGPVLRNLFAD